MFPDLLKGFCVIVLNVRIHVSRIIPLYRKWPFRSPVMCKENVLSQRASLTISRPYRKNETTNNQWENCISLESHENYNLTIINDFTINWTIRRNCLCFEGNTIRISFVIHQKYKYEKENLSSDDQQFHQCHQNEQSRSIYCEIINNRKVIIFVAFQRNTIFPLIVACSVCNHKCKNPGINGLCKTHDNLCTRNNHLSSCLTEHKYTTTNEAGNPITGLGQSQNMLRLNRLMYL
jgi:hypothetical protein